MKKIGQGVASELERISNDSDHARIMSRACQVNNRYKAAIEHVYGESAQIFLDHTNSVYIVNKDGVCTLIVYMEESIYAADLNARRELVKLTLREMFGEEIDTFEIYVSRGKYKSRHPFEKKPEQNIDDSSSKNTGFATRELTESEQEYIQHVVSTIEDERLRASIEKAMKADLKRN